MKRLIVFLVISFALLSCLPDGWDVMTTLNIEDYWIHEDGDVVETLDLDKRNFIWTKQSSGVDLVTPVKGTYSVRTVYDYGYKWYVLILEPEGDDHMVFSFKATLTEDKRVLTLEGSDIATYYRVEKTKDSDKEEEK